MRKQIPKFKFYKMLTWTQKVSVIKDSPTPLLIKSRKLSQIKETNQTEKNDDYVE